MREQGVWALAWKRFRRDRLGFASLIVVLVYVAIMLGAAAGWLGRDWNAEAGVSFAPPTFLGPEAVESPQLAKAAEGAQAVADYGIADPLAPDLTEIAKTLSGASTTSARAVTLPLGGDKWGRDVLKKVLKGTQTSLVVGLSAAALAAFLGTLFGALAGFRGGWVDDFFNWLYSVFTSIPSILLVFALAAVLRSGPLGHVFASGIWTVVIILAVTGWTGMYRLVRAEYMKHREREYVLAAQAIGASAASRMFVHILPNVSHVILVQLSLLVVAFIKVEVILSFLGLGVPLDMVSWGTMLSEAQTELIIGKWWQLTAATVFMAIFLTAFSMLTDSLRDALDPKLR